MKIANLVNLSIRQQLSLVSFMFLFGFMGSLIFILPKAGYTQVLPDTAANRARGVVGCTQTRSGISCSGGSSSGGGSYGGYSPEAAIIQGIGNAIGQGIQRAINEAQRIRREREAYAFKLNEAGNDYSRRGMNEEAAEQYRLALQYSPNDRTIANNLRLAEQRIEEWRQLTISVEKGKVAKKAIDSMLDDLTSRWGATGSIDAPVNMDFVGSQTIPSEEPLAFFTSNEPLFSKGTKLSAPVDLSFNDSTVQPVVDPRVVKGEMTPEEAEKLRKDERQVKAATALAAVFVGKGDYDEALEYLRDARELKPDDLGIKNAINYTHYLKEQEIINSNRSPKAEVLLDALEYGSGDWQASMDYLKDLHKKDPDNLYVRDALDFSEGLSGYYVKPDELFIPTDRGNLQPLTGEVKELQEHGLASIYSRDYEKAYEYFSKAHKLNPDDYGIRSVMHFSEGLWAAGRTDQ